MLDSNVTGQHAGLKRSLAHLHRPPGGGEAAVLGRACQDVQLERQGYLKGLAAALERLGRAWRFMRMLLQRACVDLACRVRAREQHSSLSWPSVRHPACFRASAGSGQQGGGSPVTNQMQPYTAFNYSVCALATQLVRFSIPAALKTSESRPFMQ